MAELTILFDGGCPLCLREVRFLEQRDRRIHPSAPRLAFVDIDAAGYDPAAHGGIGYREAMGRIHALEASGAVVRDVEVFRRAYQLIGLGWLYAPTGWPLLAPLVNALYAIWASARLRITGRPSLEQLCAVRGGRCGGAPAAGNRAAVGVVPSPGSADLERTADAAAAGGL
jgi:predicted DCC family thiol-disulfide oxidoreductase YuxK